MFIKSSFINSYEPGKINSLKISDSLDVPGNDSLQTAADLLKGRELYEKKCKTCHTLYEPKEFKLKVWKENLEEMKVKADLSKNEYKLIYNYLAANCKK